ncbi:hypothetical protein AB0B66_10505 [Catellatospora sp. NPDC049111]|uniref:hypothetical protein n=1 Tax=Catellatospora sp. NPDC049111 TaxID=3155271 RepID=UPI00340A2EF6
MPDTQPVDAPDPDTDGLSRYDVEDLSGTSDGDPEGSQLIGELISRLQTLCQQSAYTTFDYELRNEDGRSITGSRTRGPAREIAVAYSDSGRRVNIQVPRPTLTDQRWYEVIFYTANRHESSAEARFTDPDEVMHHLGQWLAFGTRPPRRFTHADVLAHITHDLGDGFRTATVDLADNDATWAPGTSKKELTGAGRYLYQITAAGCWVIQEPDFARLVPLTRPQPTTR